MSQCLSTYPSLECVAMLLRPFRPGLGNANRIQALRKHRARWQPPKLVDPMVTPDHTETQVLNWFVEGTFTGEPVSSTTRGCTRIIDSDQLHPRTKALGTLAGTITWV